MEKQVIQSVGFRNTKDENGNIIDTSKPSSDDEESTDIFKPSDGIVEGAVNAELLADENAAVKRIQEGRANEYNPNWTTPPSELMEIPEMPLIPKDMHEHAINEYASKPNWQSVQRPS